MKFMACPKWSFNNGHTHLNGFRLDQSPILEQQTDPDAKNHISAKTHHNNVILAGFTNEKKKNNRPHEV